MESIVRKVLWWRIRMARRQRKIRSEKRSQQLTAVHSSSQHRIKNAVISFASHRAIQEPSACNFILKNGHSTVTACATCCGTLLDPIIFLRRAIDRLQCGPRGAIPLPDCEKELDTENEPFLAKLLVGIHSRSQRSGSHVEWIWWPWSVWWSPSRPCDWMIPSVRPITRIHVSAFDGLRSLWSRRITHASDYSFLQKRLQMPSCSPHCTPHEPRNRLIQQRLQPRFEGSLSLRDGGGMRQLNTIYQRIGINGTEDGQTSGARR